MIRRAPAADTTDDDWDLVARGEPVRASSACAAPRRASRCWRRAGQHRQHCLAAVVPGGHPVPGYAASKGGVAQLTKALANEWASQGRQRQRHRPGLHRAPTTRPRCAPTDAQPADPRAHPGRALGRARRHRRRGDSSSARMPPATSPARCCWSTAAGWRAEHSAATGGPIHRLTRRGSSRCWRRRPPVFRPGTRRPGHGRRRRRREARA